MRSAFCFFSALVLMIVGVPGAGAQPSGPAAPSDSARIEQTIADMKAKVKISDAQAAEIRPILKENTAAMRRDRASGQFSRDAARERMLAMDEKIMAVLTAEQVPLYNTYREERRQMMRNRMREMQEKQQ
jgi:hypothetical protein